MYMLNNKVYDNVLDKFCNYQWNKSVAWKPFFFCCKFVGLDLALNICKKKSCFQYWSEERSSFETKMFEHKSCLETKRSDCFETTIFAGGNLAFNPNCLNKSLASKPKISAAERSFFETKMFEQKKLALKPKCLQM